jgi:hypothetical protein
LFMVKSWWIYMSMLENFEAFLGTEKWTRSFWHRFLYLSCGSNLYYVCARGKILWLWNKGIYF